MSLLKQVIKAAEQKELIETAAAGATSAGAVAGFRAPIGGTSEKTKMVRRNMPKIFATAEEEESPMKSPEEMERDKVNRSARFNKALRRQQGLPKEEEMEVRTKRRKGRKMGGPTGGVFSLRFEGALNEGPEDERFDPSDVLSKLRAAEERAQSEDNTVGFALEDSDGQIVKVYVAADEAEEFERALGAALSGEDEDDDNQNTPLEIAEVLFNLKDRFSIVDVVWPPVQGDPEEQETTEDDLDVDVEADAAEEGDLEADAEGDEGEGDEEADMEAELQDEDGDGEPDGGEEEAASALQSVIDMMKAQADAQKAEANAKEAEANAEEAKYNAQAAELKMRQEEEVLDMEAHNDKKKKEESEAKKLKDLARFRHEQAQEAGDQLAGVSVSKEVDVDLPEEDEEKVYGEVPGEEMPGNKFEQGWDENRDRRMTPGEFIRYILQHQRGQ